jgi:Tfp pilus assembly protein PilW
VEVLIASSLGAFVLAGVLTSFVLLGRSGVAVQNYSRMETEGRRTLEDFAQDVRMASGIVLNTGSPYTSITLTFTAPEAPDTYASYGNQVTYAYDSSNSTLYVLPGSSSSTATRRVLMRDVTSLSFTFYDRLNNSTTALASIKRVLLSGRLQRNVDANATGNSSRFAVQSDTVVSACAVMRNRTAN